MSRGGSGFSGELGRPVAWALGLVVLMMVLAALVQWTRGAQGRALAAMEPGKRAEVFERSMASVESLCREDPGPALASDCRSQADFLRQFPECTQGCRVEVGRYLHSWGTR